MSPSWSSTSLASSTSAIGPGSRGATREALCLLAQHPWRGNVRELEAVLGQAMIFRGGDLITSSDLDLPMPKINDIAENKAVTGPHGLLTQRRRSAGSSTRPFGSWPSGAKSAQRYHRSRPDLSRACQARARGSCAAWALAAHRVRARRSVRATVVVSLESAAGPRSATPRRARRTRRLAPVLDVKRPWALHDGHARSSRHAEISLGCFRSVSEIRKPGLNQQLNDRKNHRRRDTEHEHSVCCF
jgi:hypothetical protein